MNNRQKLLTAKAMIQAGLAPDPGQQAYNDRRAREDKKLVEDFLHQMTFTSLDNARALKVMVYG